MLRILEFITIYHNALPNGLDGRKIIFSNKLKQ